MINNPLFFKIINSKEDIIKILYKIERYHKTYPIYVLYLNHYLHFNKKFTKFNVDNVKSHLQRIFKLNNVSDDFVINIINSIQIITINIYLDKEVDRYIVLIKELCILEILKKDQNIYKEAYDVISNPKHFIRKYSPIAKYILKYGSYMKLNKDIESYPDFKKLSVNPLIPLVFGFYPKADQSSFALYYYNSTLDSIMVDSIITDEYGNKILLYPEYITNTKFYSFIEFLE